MEERAPAVAGMFYPADARELEATISAMLRGAAPAAREGDRPSPKALIVPHAGYPYSGPVAASAYARLLGQREQIRRVVLLGPAHRVAVRGLAAPTWGAVRTPLGRIRVDRAALAAILDLPQIVESDRAHELEHSLEVQLPFLQHVLADFELVPLVVGEASDAEVAEVLERLWGGDETLIVVSSDLSHFHDYATARRMDAATCRAIEDLRPGPLGHESACGRVPVRGLLRAARHLGLVPRTLDLRSSGDTAGDRERVVGYGAWSFCPPTRRSAGRGGDATASSPEDSLLLQLALHSISYGLERRRPPAVDLATLPPGLRRPGACFVTLRDPSGRLRGCIGSLEATRAIAEDVVENAFAAAFLDPRMVPISGDELETIRIGISILGPLEAIPARSLADVLQRLRPGRDGLVLSDGGHRGTLLPQVWTSLRSPREFAAGVWQKAGLPGDHWSPTARAHRFEVRKVEAS